jgi:hypothetical protein
MGWYLIVPPPVGTREGAIAPDVKAPISQWVQMGQYDNAYDCSTAQYGALRFLGPQMDHVTRKIATLPSSDNLLSETKRKLFQKEAKITFSLLAIIKAQCISSDDPRLKEVKARNLHHQDGMQ